MADEKILKPKSFRITDETADAFKQISAEIGGNQQEALAKLIETYEFQKGKAILTEKKADIDQFEQYITVLTRMYMSSLEDNQNITTTVRTEFEALLQSKDQTIQDLQSQLTTAKQLKEESTIKAKNFSDENARLNDYIKEQETKYSSQIENLQSQLSDKDSLNQALTGSCNDLKSKLDTLQEEHKEAVSIRSKIAELTDKCTKLEHSKAEAENALKSENNRHEQEVIQLKQHEADALARIKEQAALEKDKALLELEKDYREQIQVLKEKKQTEIDNYQQKYFDLLQQIQSTTTPAATTLATELENNKVENK